MSASLDEKIAKLWTNGCDAFAHLVSARVGASRINGDLRSLYHYEIERHARRLLLNLQELQGGLVEFLELKSEPTAEEREATRQLHLDDAIAAQIGREKQAERERERERSSEPEPEGGFDPETGEVLGSAEPEADEASEPSTYEVLGASLDAISSAMRSPEAEGPAAIQLGPLAMMAPASFEAELIALEAETDELLEGAEEEIGEVVSPQERAAVVAADNADFEKDLLGEGEDRPSPFTEMIQSSADEADLRGQLIAEIERCCGYLPEWGLDIIGETMVLKALSDQPSIVVPLDAARALLSTLADQCGRNRVYEALKAISEAKSSESIRPAAKRRSKKAKEASNV